MTPQQTTTVPARDLGDHTLVGDSGGHSAVTGFVEDSHAMPGCIRVETEHGTLYLDPDKPMEVLAQTSAPCPLVFDAEWVRAEVAENPEGHDLDEATAEAIDELDDATICEHIQGAYGRDDRFDERLQSLRRDVIGDLAEHVRGDPGQE